MQLEGSCHCQRVRFTLESSEPCPYQLCYCSICRKTGGAGYMINLGGDAKTLQVRGFEFVRGYRAMQPGKDGAEPQQSKHQRFFCAECGSHLWASNTRWPELVHPVASAIDTELPPPPQRTHMMLGSKANWVSPDLHEGDASFDEYPRISLAQWHREHGLVGLGSEPLISAKDNE